MAPPDSKSEYRKQWRQSNADRVKAYWRQWYETNAEKRRAYNERYHAEHPERARNGEYRRRLLIEQAGTSYTKSEWEELCARYGNVCLACGQPKPLEVDHVVPLSKGGANSIGNIQPLCRSCNSSKYNKVIDYR